MGALRRFGLAVKIGMLAAGLAAAVSACGSISVENPDGSTGVGGMPGGGTGGGTAGGVGGGAGAMACADIQRDFVIALADARSCNIGGVGQCALTTNDRLDCGCPTAVNRTDKVDVVRQVWIRNGCSSGNCPAKLCSIVTTAACAISTTSSQAVCQ